MNNNLCLKLFDDDILKCKKISISKNEIYNQLLLYIFFKSKKNLLLVYPTLNEATNYYNELKNYIDEVYLFPEDDLISKKAIAASPELLFLRVNLLNKINDDKQKIIIVHLNSFIKKLPNKNKYIENKINIKNGSILKREEFIKKLIENGYKRESTVYNTAEFSVRGFVIDIFPIEEENPIRIELFDDVVEKIKYFDVTTQKSIKEIDEISIGTIKDDFGDNNSNIRDYINDGIVIYTNYNQIVEQEKMLLPQVKYLEMENEIFKLSSLVNKEDMFLDTINNRNYDIKIEAKSIEKYSSNKEKFLNDIINTNGTLYTTNELLRKDLLSKNKNINIVNGILNHGFIYENIIT